MKMHTIMIPTNVRKTIKMSEYAVHGQFLELIVGASSQIICIDDRVVHDHVVDSRIIITAYKNAQLTYCDQRRFYDDAQVIDSITLTAEPDSVIRFEQRQQGGQKIKTMLDAQLIGQSAEIIIRVGARISGNQNHELYTKQYHRTAYGKSSCTVKMIVAGDARSLYEGMIEVDPSARQTEAFQNHKALLMSDAAYAFAQPSLQVQTDDVQCGHGSAIGQLDAQQLEYLHARGIDQDRAKEILLDAFMQDLYVSEYIKSAFEK